MKSSIIFFGSSEYSLCSLIRLYKKRYRVLGVVTSPDKQVGRKQEIKATAVKVWAEKRKIPVLTPGNKKELEEEIREFAGNCEVDFLVVCVYGMMLSKKVLDLPKYGSLNIHPSLLPKYRGSSPGQAAIANGDKVTGVSIILMDEKMDHGPIVGQVKEKIEKNDTADSLYKRLFDLGADLLVRAVEEIKQGKMTPLPQDDQKATYTKVLKREDGKIDWSWPGEKIERFVRAMSDWPGAWTKVELKSIINKAQKIKRLKILKAHLEGGKLVLDKVQLAGKRPVSWKQFCEGYPKAKIITP